MNPEVSVILPFFNAGATLPKAIQSILSQSFTNFELLLVNNNSTDGSIETAHLFSQKDRRARLLTETKQGVANAMNCGLNNAAGQFIARMDADDFSHPDRLSKQVEFLQHNKEIGLVGSLVKYVAHEKNTAGFERFVNWNNSVRSADEIELNRFVEMPVVNPTLLFRREVFEKWGGCLQGDFPEDYEMLLRYLEAGVKMHKLPEPLLEWHDYPHRLTRTDDRYSTDAFFRIKAKYFYLWSEKNNPFHPGIWVWGAGRKTRQRAKILEKEGIIINGYFDIVKNKTTSKTTLHFTEIPLPGNLFIVPMVGKAGVSQKIKRYLLMNNYSEGKDFLMMS